jgi:hypothetical protein
MSSDLGRGPEATADMKARIAALRSQGLDLDSIIETLWARSHRAEAEERGYRYEFAPPGAEPLRPGRQRRR